MPISCCSPRCPPKCSAGNERWRGKRGIGAARGVVAEGRGSVSVAEGDGGVSIYWLERGQVAILKRREDENLALRTLEAGDCFGEVALVDFGPRSASVRAVVDCAALEITTGLLREIREHDLEQFTLITMNLGRELSRRLRSAEARLLRSDPPRDDTDPVPTT